VRPFRFRAQAALDLRKREHDDATRVYAQAERELLAASASVQEAGVRLSAARTMHAAALGGVGEGSDLQWYRFWILRLEQERRAETSRMLACEEKLAAARAVCQRTKQRLESLERLKGRTRDAYDRAAGAAAQKQNDMIGTLRFVARRRAG
jgi:flagellar export protein FliJ